MERLTEPGYEYHSCDFMDDGIYIDMNRLREYEDTGLTPDQIRKIDTLYPEKCREVEKYKSINEEGRLVILPCKAGDVLFCFSLGKIYPFEVRCIRIYKERIEIELWYAGDEENLKFWHISIAEQDIGYKFFFTYEEAEKALEGMK